MDEDNELLRRFAEEGSQEAFTTLVQRHFDLVYSAARRQVDGDDPRAREVAQAVFIDLAAKARKLCRHPALRGWLYTSTHFAARNLRRAEGRRRRRELTAHAMQELSASSATPADWGPLSSRLDEAMQALRPDDREVLLLRFFSQQRFAEIGDRLGLSEKAAHMRTERALEKLRVALGRRGITSTAGALALALADHAVVAAPAGCSAAVAGSVLANLGAAASGGAVAAGVYYSATPLTPATSEQLVGIIAAQSPAYQGGGEVDPATLDWDRVLAAAQGVLAPGQLAALQSVRAQRELDQLQDQGAEAALTAPATP